MPDYTPADIVDILLILGECQGNFHATARLYAQRYPDRQHPNDGTIRRLKMRAQNGQLTRRRQHKIYDENDVRVLAVLASVHLDPHTSSRTIQREIGIPHTTVLKILKIMKYHAYHITLVQALTPDDFQNRAIFCRWVVRQIQMDPNFFKFVMFSDESTFKNNGEVNRHNCHYWLEVNPYWFRPVDNQHRWSVMVWCGIINGQLVGPYFFQENVTRRTFLEMLRNHLPGMLENIDLETRRRMWIQLDGAPPHNAVIVRNFLNNRYPERWIGRAGPVAWPARSPDLTSPDFFLWGYVKNVVYSQRPTTREDMINRIKRACAAIPRNVLLGTITNFERRVRLCLEVNGANFEQLLRG